ncbi:MAG: 3-deoxy-manno-octulosonate cytidylyltransferase [Treponema sp.]|jgi:3-deoxy-manno-octulosonate cytidylyltransferase (CMP-KDO synthetase)|nr:3-deoxy-manno-octulosonate cytidylyltransferase [Treponema sp.]
MKIVGVIPARYGSSRLPGKPLADICGKPMIWWVYQQAIKAKKLSDVFVATDDKRIIDVCTQYNICTIMTRNDHITAANRLHEVSEYIGADFYLQLNGDEPLINPETIDMAIPNEVPKEIEFGTNIITKIQYPTESMDASNIKVVFDSEFNALYMSRIPIPYPFKSTWFSYYKHVGIIGYNKVMLDFYAHSKPGHLETIEGIDTLRFIDYGKNLRFIEVAHGDSLSVDTEADLIMVRKIIEKKIVKYMPPPPPSQ